MLRFAQHDNLRAVILSGALHRLVQGGAKNLVGGLPESPRRLPALGYRARRLRKKSKNFVGSVRIATVALGGAPARTRV